jgi:hypothetical protein
MANKSVRRRNNESLVKSLSSAKPTVNMLVEIKLLKIDDLNVDRSYQRPPSPTHVAKIVANFIEEALDPILVAIREDGTFWIVDGQTRRDVMVIKNYDRIPCRLFRSKGSKHEATIFGESNLDRRAMKRYDAHRALVKAEKPAALAVEESVRAHKLEIAYRGTWPYIRAVAKLYDAQREGVLDAVLSAIVRTWPNDAEALSELCIGACYEFFKKFPEAEFARCVNKWRRLTTSTFMADAKAAKNATGGSRYRALALTFMEEYNKGLRKNRLEWTKATS